MEGGEMGNLFGTVKVHVFDSSGFAYDMSQCSDEIKDGDVLYVPSESVAAVMVRAWPVTPKVGAVQDETTMLHVLKDGYTIEEVIVEVWETALPSEVRPDYAEAIEIAIALCKE